MSPFGKSFVVPVSLPWPLPALLVWALAWAVFALMARLGAPAIVALLLASLLGVAGSALGSSGWRRLFIAAGFPLSLLLSGAAHVAAWHWLLPLALLLLVYPINAWRDAPLFPTPRDGLRGLDRLVPLPDGALVLEAGCGLGDGLVALRAAYPRVHLHGLEWSWPLRAASAWRCPWARVRQGDIWRADWRPYRMVYLFQRPESMARAVEKAAAEMLPGAWLVSLEFPATELLPQATLQGDRGRPVWAYQVPFKRAKPGQGTR